MERAVEWFIAVTAFIAGTSHVVRPADWAAAFQRLHAVGRSGAFVNGALSLVPGAMILAGHRVWTFPGVVLTAFGILLLLKSAICLLAPDTALRSMGLGGRSPRSFVTAGVVLIAIGAWAIYCLRHGR